jgi:hypothetical protein
MFILTYIIATDLASEARNSPTLSTKANHNMLVIRGIYGLVHLHLLLICPSPFNLSDTVEKRHDCNVYARVFEQAPVEFAERFSTSLPERAHYTVEVGVEVVADCEAAGED